MDIPHCRAPVATDILATLMSAEPQAQPAASDSPLTHAGFIPLQKRARFLIATLYVCVATSALAALIGVASTPFLQEQGFGHEVGPIGSLLILASAALSLIDWGVYVVTAIVFFVWFYPAYANLRSLKARHISHEPYWAFLGFMVPLVNLVHPPEMMSEAWKESEPVNKQDAPEDLLRPPWIGTWWITFLVFNLVSWVSSTVIYDKRDPSTWLTSELVLTAATALAIVSVLCLITAVRAITARQEHRLRELYRPDDPH